MSYIVSIDPGLRACGVAVFDADTDELVDCTCVHVNMGYGVSQRTQMAAGVLDWIAENDYLDDTIECIVELMVIRRRGKRKYRGDVSADLIRLSHVTGAIWAGFDEGVRLTETAPRDWTGGRNKTKNHPRIIRRLSLPEKERLQAVLEATLKDNRKEVLDAVGIGLYEIGRL